MSKRKILTLAMALSIVAIMAVGATLAYFTDTDSEVNTFTTGKIDIDLIEEFDEAKAKLLPGTQDANFIPKVVTVKNENDSEKAYVRVHIALPSKMVDQNLNSYNDMLHWNFAGADYAAGKWSMLKTYSEGNGWGGNGRENQNVYNTTIGDKDYTVWVVTYRSELAAGATTAGAAMTQVYMDWRTETKDGVVYTKANYDAAGNKVEGTDFSYSLTADGEIEILVFAEGTQSESQHANAYEALNAAFGTPGAAGYVAPWNKAN